MTDTPTLYVVHPLPAGDAPQDTWTLASIGKPGNGYWFCHDTEQAARLHLKCIDADDFYLAWDLYHNTTHIEGDGQDRYASLTFRLSQMLAAADLAVIRNRDRVIHAAMRPASPPAHIESVMGLVEQARANAQWWLARLVDATVQEAQSGKYHQAQPTDGYNCNQFTHAWIDGKPVPMDDFLGDIEDNQDG